MAFQIAHEQTPVLISLSLLVGTFFGQIIVGILADRYGRKRMYGIELLVLTLATIFFSLSSKGALASTNGLVWIVAWRFIMGLGIGGDYPLSAVITAEYVDPVHVSGCSTLGEINKKWQICSSKASRSYGRRSVLYAADRSSHS